MDNVLIEGDKLHQRIMFENYMYMFVDDVPDIIRGRATHHVTKDHHACGVLVSSESDIPSLDSIIMKII